MLAQLFEKLLHVVRPLFRSLGTKVAIKQHKKKTYKVMHMCAQVFNSCCALYRMPGSGMKRMLKALQDNARPNPLEKLSFARRGSKYDIGS